MRQVPPRLLEQLATPGRLVIPIGPAGGDQVLHVIDRLPDGTLRDSEEFGVRYVPFHMHAADAEVPAARSTR